VVIVAQLTFSVPLSLPSPLAPYHADRLAFFCPIFWALHQVNSCVRQLRGFCFPGSAPSFIDSEQFLTKAGDVGMILEVPGLDYECLDASTIDNLTKRLESAFRFFDENFRVYQHLFKRNNPAIPFKLSGIPVVDAANRNRIAYLDNKADDLFSLSRRLPS
jgi:hypothetical protein